MSSTSDRGFETSLGGEAFLQSLDFDDWGNAPASFLHLGCERWTGLKHGALLKAEPDLLLFKLQDFCFRLDYRCNLTAVALFDWNLVEWPCASEYKLPQTTKSLLSKGHLGLLSSWLPSIKLSNPRKTLNWAVSTEKMTAKTNRSPQLTNGALLHCEEGLGGNWGSRTYGRTRFQALS